MKYRSVRPEMGHYFYTRCGRAAYVAYAMCCGSPLPLQRGQEDPYARAMGFIFGVGGPYQWESSGEYMMRNYKEYDLVERITMECAFQYPNRRQRPKRPAAETQGRLL